MVTAG